MVEILPAVKFVTEQAQSVSIDRDALQKVASTFEIAQSKHWLHEAPFDFSVLSIEETANFIFLFYSLIFCFWGEPKWTIEYHSKKYDGSYGLLVALARAQEEGFSILNWHFWQNISREEFAKIMRGNVEIPLLTERWQIVRAIGEEIMRNLNGSVVTLITASHSDAQVLLSFIDKHFPSFRDVSNYRGHVIPFYKRAQLFIVDLYYFFAGKDLGHYKNIETITALSDYKLPQTLRGLGVLVYKPELAGKVDNKVQITHDSEEEIEIRAATVWSIELLRKELITRFPQITASTINDSLWLASQKQTQDVKPYHRTLNIYY